MKQNLISTLLASKISDRSAQVAVMGIGYVGLPLAVASAEAGFATLGIDPDKNRVELVQQGKSYSPDIDSQTVGSLVQKKKLWATSDFSSLKDYDIIYISVPTLMDEKKNPDLSFVLGAAREIKKHLRPGQLIILQSTTFPGTTQEVLLPILGESGLEVGKDFFLAYSPERIDPGNDRFNISNTPKVVGGITPDCTQLIQQFYQTFIDTVVPVSSTKAAEMVKVVENSFRIVNIAFANELALSCSKLGINTWEVLEAAATKPFGFMLFYPGPGIGGRCIPVTPHFLRWKMESVGSSADFIRLADKINTWMPEYVVQKTLSELKSRKVETSKAKILVLGVAYKRDIDDYQYSPALDIIHGFEKKIAQVSYHDPFVPQIKIGKSEYHSISIDQELENFDAVVLTTHHTKFDLGKIVERSKLFIDTRNATKNIKNCPEKIVRLYS